MTPEDAASYSALLSHPEVRKYFGASEEVCETKARELIETISAGINSGESIRWCIVEAEKPGQLIGTVGFWQWLKPHFRAITSYELHPAYWRRGYSLEALSAALHFAVEVMGVHTVEASIDPENTASIQLAEKAGFVKEGLLRENYFANGKFTDTAVLTYHAGGLNG
jgi:ribosomal-protein-alanine N-acetyltransferase